ncbi:MAG: DUF3419 family protein [Deltaproteobacteria bacterium]|nr:DUF3419 family protein [Deltaproteobacteria bacterium]
MDRQSLPDAVRRPLLFARVWEDPLLELEAFAPRADRNYVVVGSGGCTALSMLAVGARRVVAIDVNPTQNDLAELKAALVRTCDADEAIAFLGHSPASRKERAATYRRIRPDLSIGARTHWDARAGAIREGVERSGMTERITRVIALITRAFVHPRSRIEELLRQPTLDAQRDFYDRQWNSARWRAMIAVLGSRHIFALGYKPASFQHDKRVEFADHYARLFEHAVTALPVANNYFLHQVFLGKYPAGQPDGRPPYLDPVNAERLRDHVSGLSFVDGSYTAYLRRCAPNSIDGFSLSNICEWMAPAAIDEMFGEIERTATTSAVICFRNNFADTQVPVKWRDVVVEDRARSEEMSRRDRSIVTPRFAVCHFAARAAARTIDAA